MQVSNQNDFCSKLNNTPRLGHVKFKAVWGEYSGMVVKVEKTHFIGKFIGGSEKLFADEIYIPRTAAAGKSDGGGEKSAVAIQFHRGKRIESPVGTDDEVPVS